jgi:hypothetical protein
MSVVVSVFNPVSESGEYAGFSAPYNFRDELSKWSNEHRVSFSIQSSEAPDLSNILRIRLSDTDAGKFHDAVQKATEDLWSSGQAQPLSGFESAKFPNATYQGDIGFASQKCKRGGHRLSATPFDIVKGLYPDGPK